MLFDEGGLEPTLAAAATILGADDEWRTHCRRCGLDSQRRTLCGALSTGERKRLQVVQELMHRPLVLLLDEPTTGLSDTDALAFMRLLAERASEDVGRLYVVVLHQPRLEIIEGLASVVLLTPASVAAHGTVDALAAAVEGAPAAASPLLAVLDALHANPGALRWDDVVDECLPDARWTPPPPRRGGACAAFGAHVRMRAACHWFHRRSYAAVFAIALFNAAVMHAANTDAPLFEVVSSGAGYFSCMSAWLAVEDGRSHGALVQRNVRLGRWGLAPALLATWAVDVAAQLVCAVVFGSILNVVFQWPPGTTIMTVACTAMIGACAASTKHLVAWCVASEHHGLVVNAAGLLCMVCAGVYVPYDELGWGRAILLANPLFYVYQAFVPAIVPDWYDDPWPVPTSLGMALVWSVVVALLTACVARWQR